MTSKECFKCNTIKPLSEFYRHPMMGDGHLGKCKTCTKADVADRETRLRNTDPEWTARERERCRNKQTVARFLGKAAKMNPETSRKWKKLNPHKYRAHTKVGNAVRDGIILKPSHCNRCGTETAKLHAHHEDYFKPLAVEWLCHPCHGLTWRKDQ